MWSDFLTRTRLASAGVVALILLGANVAAAEVPLQFQYQGRLLNDQGEPVTGEKTLQFSIYDAKTQGSILWQSQKTIDLGSSGHFSVTLGSKDNPIEPGVLVGDKRWLNVSLPSGISLKPRLPLKSVPYSLLAAKAESVSEGAVDKSALKPSLQTEIEQAKTSADWSDIEGKPAEVSDGDNDTLANLTCQSGFIAKYDGRSWTCSPDNDALGSLPCRSGQRAQYDGSQWTCVTPDTYNGQNFAVSDQKCNSGKVAVGIDVSGNLICQTDQDTTYDGSDFAKSDQGCSSGDVVTGVDASGNVTCATDQNTTYDGSDFAKSNQGCSSGDMVT
ncbi:MAG: hypothetical protein ABEN55_20060, partial [Bradymonadaceae bacterium]